MAEFDVMSSPLRVEGRDAVPQPLLVEAGAGSGKTWTLAHLATRFMIEDGVEPGEMLLVTFTRDAARELRGRVRDHLSEVIEFLEDPAATGGGAPWRDHLARRWVEDGARMRDLRRARHCRATLDALHARTIHSFAAVNVVTSGARSDDGRLWRQAVNGTLSRWALERPELLAGDEVDRATLDAVANALYQAGVRRGETATAVRVEPAGPGGDTPGNGAERTARVQRDMAREIVARFSDLLLQAGRTSYADLVVALADRLEHRDAQRFVAELRATFRVVMIDEFQDTDPLQWHVFREVFLDAPATRLVLVGDPKQAIYGFRSGAVETFLEVRDYCRSRGIPGATLGTNYRSTPALVDAVNRLFVGTDFHYPLAERAEPVIGFTPARAERADLDPAARVGPGVASLHLRAAKYASTNDERTLEEVAAYVGRARAAGYAYRDVAVLCWSNRQCAAVHRHLSRQRIPSVTASGESIFACPAATQLRLLLRALASPEDVGLTEALRVTWFRGRHAADPSSGEMGRWVTQLSGEFARVGVGAVTRFLRSRAVEEVVLGTRDGERNLTDLHHLGELLGRECDGLRSVALVVDWLDAASTSLDADEAVTARRLETESDAVRVLTVHKSKGQEFAVVLLPFVRESYRAVGTGRDALQRWVEGGVTVVDAGSGVAWGDASDVAARRLRTEAAQAGERRRFLYVALTRARDAAVLWCALPRNTPFSGELTRLLFDRAESPAGSSVRNRTIGEVRDHFVGATKTSPLDERLVAARADPAGALRATFADTPTIEVFTLGADPVPAVGAGATGPDVVAASAFVAGRAPGLAYERRRWSYSAVAADLKATAEGDAELDDAPGLDEAAATDGAELDDERVREDVAGVFGSLAGPGLGVLVHQVLDAVLAHPEASVDDLVTGAFAREAGRLGATAGDVARVAASLRELLGRPLVPTLAGRTLADLAPGDVATEMRFTLALAGPPSPERLVAALAAVGRLDQSGEDGRGLFADYLGAGWPVEGQLSEGFLVGSLDLTVRGVDGRYRIVDYKTDQLPGARRPYAPARLRRHMEAAHYPLQALFYSVALHRFLRHRLAGYDPAHHLGGVDYLFVRVVGDGSAQGDDGVAAWPISPVAVAAASDILGGDDA
ncbi:MAG: UvrD-helicase domain-containing protein [Acidimicrobiales bacterium]